MKEPFTPHGGWGPQSKRGALCLTFDNLGEAAEIERGEWGDQPVGRHYTADFIPRLIDALGDVRGTYFMEASNARIYPQAIRRWAAAGHEVGLHAWRHEVWERCDPARRRRLLADCQAAMRAVGVTPTGFRPPGGAIPLEAWQEFADAGLEYCSDLGSPGAARIGRMVALPFNWHSVDVYMLEEVMGFMRIRCGDPEPPLTMPAWKAQLESVVQRLVAEGGQHTVIFHPHFLAVDDDKLAVVVELIEWARAADLWIAPAGDVARFVAAETGGRATAAA